MITLTLRWIATILLAVFLGKLASKIKLPSILGWLVAGMILGPFALNLLPQTLIDTQWYGILMHYFECVVGLMIGTELVYNRIRKYGRALIITTLFQSLGTFIVVSFGFLIIFMVMNIPLYLAFIFGGIALATAPAPALSIVREFHTDGPVTRTLIPMAALDDMVGVVVFFTTIAIIARNITGGDLPLYIIPVMIFLPIIIGGIIGLPTGYILKKLTSRIQIVVVLLIAICITTMVGMFGNKYLMPLPLLNFMLMGMAFSAVFSNIVSEDQLDKIMKCFNPVLGMSMIIVIINLGAPLDYRKILGSGIFTIAYIIMRGCGKYFGARIGASITKMPNSVRKYLGFTLLPHSGVSLVFSGIAASMLAKTEPECAAVITGTIAAAAIINEIVAVIMAKKGFEWAKEFGKAG